MQSARSAASSGDTVNIWADLSNEQILLKNGVDIWIAPGRIIEMTSANPTILDNDSGYTTAVTCNITGYGIIKNSSSFGSAFRECVKITNPNSKVSIVCNVIEGLGGDDQSVYQGVSVLVSANDTSSFSLICNRLTNKNNAAIFIENVGRDEHENNIFIKAKLIETGILNNSASGTSAMIIEGKGFIEADEVICRNYGSCLIHKKGSITANIMKLTTINNTSTILPTVNVSGGDGTQDLTIYFDEINNLGGGDAVKITQGRANIIGRSIYSNSGLSLNLTGDVVSANFQCVDIISGTKGINIANSDEAVVIDANYIEGGIGNSGVIKSVANSVYILRNAKIKCTDTTSNSVCIYLPDGNQNDQNIEIENLILVTGNTNSGATMKRIGNNTIQVKNLGLFVNKAIDESKIILEIGLGLNDPNYNYKYIISTDIS